jgi:hypothetical protein
MAHELDEADLQVLQQFYRMRKTMRWHPGSRFGANDVELWGAVMLYVQNARWTPMPFLGMVLAAMRNERMFCTVGEITKHMLVGVPSHLVGWDEGRLHWDFHELVRRNGHQYLRVSDVGISDADEAAFERGEQP